MSENVLITGKLVPVVNQENIKGMIIELISSKTFNVNYQSLSIEEVEEMVEEYLYNSYVFYKGNLYKKEDFESHESGGDLYQATENLEGTISLMLQYYNGGCDESEAIEEALDNLRKE